MEDENKMSSGLANTPTAEYPKVGKKAQDLTPIQRLANPETHARVKDYLCARIKMSETEMNKFKPRWQVNEKKYQAYVTLPKYEEALKQMNDTASESCLCCNPLYLCDSFNNRHVSYPYIRWA